MSNFKQQYKNPRQGFGDVSHNRNVRAYNQLESRKKTRTRAFDQNRELQDVSRPATPESETVSTIKDERMKKLIKWRAERDRKKRLETTKKKPVFKVGIVHHSFCSPILKPNALSTASKSSKQKKQQNDMPKRITRATEKRLLAKATSRAQIGIVSKNTSSALMKDSINISTQNHPTSDKKKLKSFAPTDHKFRPPSGVLKMPLFGLVPIEQTPQEKEDFFIRAQSSECKELDTNNLTQIKNNQKDALPQTIDMRMSDVKKSIAEFKISSSPKLLSKQQGSPQMLNRSASDPINTTFEVKETTRASDKTDKKSLVLQDQVSLSDNNENIMKTPTQKIVSVKSVDSADDSKGNFDSENLIAFSPYLTLSRGKKNARKEQQQRLGIGRLSSDEIPTKDTVMRSLNISVEEEERTAQYFKFLLNKETDRLQCFCKKWLDIQQSEQGVPDDAVYEINQAVGQTNLLISKKFKRFRSLVEDCETGKGEMLVTCRDLQGFWDMTYMEVENCNARFEKLEQRRDRQWQEEESVNDKFVAKKKRMPAKKQIASSKPSSLRSLILAARKKKMETETNLTNVCEKDLLPLDVNMECVTSSSPDTRKSVSPKGNDSAQRKTRSRSGSFNERRSISARSEKSKMNVLQRISFSNASKRLKSPYAAMKISQICKTPQVQLDDTITYINSSQTPGKSILKKSAELINKEACIKSAHKVNFDDDVILTETPLDEETQTRLSLAAALTRIDSLDLEELSVEESIAAERKLNFDDSDNSINFDESAIKQAHLKTQESKSLAENTLDFDVHSRNDMTSFKETSSSDEEIKTPRKSLRHQARRTNVSNKQRTEDRNVLSAMSLKTNIDMLLISETISQTKVKENNDESDVKVLRNRTITTNDITKNRTSKTMTPKRGNVSKKENKSPTKTNRKSSLKLLQKNEKRYSTPKDAIIAMENVILDVDKRRKSSRKSVAFSAETCLVCTENKPVLPMTPHSKRRSTTRPSRSNRTFNEDLISWETPEPPPNRITRSHGKNNI